MGGMKDDDSTGLDQWRKIREQPDKKTPPKEEKPCPRCNGSGYSERDKGVCPQCGGYGTV